MVNNSSYHSAIEHVTLELTIKAVKRLTSLEIKRPIEQKCLANLFLNGLRSRDWQQRNLDVSCLQRIARSCFSCLGTFPSLSHLWSCVVYINEFIDFRPQFFETKSIHLAMDFAMDLLDELWSLIFREYLDFLDTVRCRQVSKRFKFLIDHLQPTELFVYGFYDQAVHQTYRDDRDPAMWIQLRSFYFKENSSFQIVFANLRFLQLDCVIFEFQTNFNLELLNELVHLEKLYLNEVVISRSRTLRLPKLKVLSFTLNSLNEYRGHPPRFLSMFAYSGEPRLTIDCKPKTLFGVRPSLLVIKHPECVHHLSTWYWLKEIKLGKELRSFKNLRVLYTELNENLLDAFPVFEHLQELYLDRILFNVRREKEKLLNRLLSKSSKLKRIDLKIYVSEILIDPNVNASEQLFGWGKFSQKLAHYHRLPDRVRNLIEIEYGVLSSLLNSDVLRRTGIALKGGLPVDVFERFPNIKYIQAIFQAIDNEEHFAWLLSKCSRLSKLTISRENLSQSLLNRLPTVSRNLKSLKVTGSRNGETQLDLSPLYALRLLFQFVIYSDDAGPDSTFDLGVFLEKCRYLTCINLEHLEMSKDHLWTVLAKKLAKDTKVHTTITVGLYTDRELKSNLDSILQKCNEL